MNSSRLTIKRKCIYEIQRNTWSDSLRCCSSSSSSWFHPRIALFTWNDTGRNNHAAGPERQVRLKLQDGWWYLGESEEEAPLILPRELPRRRRFGFLRCEGREVCQIEAWSGDQRQWTGLLALLRGGGEGRRPRGRRGERAAASATPAAAPFAARSGFAALLS
jgi:hypothetical protein